MCHIMSVGVGMNINRNLDPKKASQINQIYVFDFMKFYLYVNSLSVKAFNILS